MFEIISSAHLNPLLVSVIILLIIHMCYTFTCISNQEKTKIGAADDVVLSN